MATPKKAAPKSVTLTANFKGLTKNEKFRFDIASSEACEGGNVYFAAGTWPKGKHPKSITFSAS